MGWGGPVERAFAHRESLLATTPGRHGLEALCYIPTLQSREQLTLFTKQATPSLGTNSISMLVAGVPRSNGFAMKGALITEVVLSTGQPQRELITRGVGVDDV